MTPVTGLIEIETEGLNHLALGLPADDATLDELFARLIRPTQDGPDEADADEDPVVLRANLDALASDLVLATRDVLAEIFLARGRR